MPRPPRLDEPGAMHHVYTRGIARQAIFHDARDRARLLRIVGREFTRSGTACFAWALMPNHYHFLVETGAATVSRVFHRVNCAYAIWFNRRHDRVGYVFQGRFRSKRVDSEAYLVGLIGYIHTNPVRAGIVTSVASLATYPWTGHCVLLGNASRRFQDVDRVLGWFGRDADEARRQMVRFVAAIPARKATEPHGTWPREAELPRRTQFDARLLGTQALVGRSTYLDEVARSLDSRRALHSAVHASGWTIRGFVDTVCHRFAADPAAVRAGRRAAPESRARAIVAHVAVDVVGEPRSEVARETGVSPQAIDRARETGRRVLEGLGISGRELVG